MPRASDIRPVSDPRHASEIVIDRCFRNGLRRPRGALQDAPEAMDRYRTALAPGCPYGCLQGLLERVRQGGENYNACTARGRIGHRCRSAGGAGTRPVGAC